MTSRPAPLFAIVLGAVALAMALPMLVALATGDEETARAFLYGGLFTAFSAAILGVALASSKRLPDAQGELLTLLLVWILIPAFAAIPLVFLTPQLGWIGAWFEMMAAFTTTGSTAYLEPEKLPPALHLWRAVMAWLGGLLTLTAAYVVLAPRRLGGFEVISAAASEGGFGDQQVRLAELGAQVAPVASRAERALRAILPVYISMTVALVMLFSAAGESGLAGVIHAVGIVSTSGITPLDGGFASVGNGWAEIAAALFLLLAVTRRVYPGAPGTTRGGRLIEDPELRLLAVLVGLSAVALFARHWLAALGDDVDERAIDAVLALWGAFFTALSFLTTTGYESAAWSQARSWSGLDNPGLILLGLCAIGGGAATTAGGLKLVRAYALWRHGVREIDRLAQPSVVLGAGIDGRGLLRQGAFVAWACIMLYTATIFGVTIALTLAGLRFETALTAALSAVTNCGPVFDAVNPSQTGYALLDATQRSILAIGMVLGRMELLSVIALFSPDAWRAYARAGKNTGNA